MQDSYADNLAGFFVLVFMYVCGGLHGFSVGTLQPHRIRRVAGIVERSWYALRGDGVTFCGYLCDRFHPCGRPGCEYLEDAAAGRARDAQRALLIGLGDPAPTTATETAA